MQKRRLKCDYDGCAKTYCSYFNLKRHIESTHMGLRKFRCQVCGRFLSSKQNYVDHQNIHTGAKPYVCEVPGCNMRFRQLSQYYLHSQLHNEDFNPPTSPHYQDQGILSLLSNRLSKEPTPYYNIPLLPYSQSSNSLPLIVYSDERQLPLDLHPVLRD